jgi:hypothetical protein
MDVFSIKLYLDIFIFAKDNTSQRKYYFFFAIDSFCMNLEKENTPYNLTQKLA